MSLKNLRNKANLTQEALANLIGVDRRSIINYEKGETIPPPIAKLIHIYLETDFINKQENEIVKVKENKKEDLSFEDLPLNKQMNKIFKLLEKQEQRLDKIEQFINEREKDLKTEKILEEFKEFTKTQKSVEIDLEHRNAKP